MNDAIIGLLGVIGIFGFTFLWTWTEERLRRRAKRKYHQQMAKYDIWKKHIDSM